MKKALFFEAAVIGWVVLSSISFGYSGGNGSFFNPYQIATKADLLTLAATTSNYIDSFILTADIDMEGQVFTTAIIAPDTSSISDYQGTPFMGEFNGNGHKITHFTINGANNSYLGLFGYISRGGVLNLFIENFTIHSSPFSEYVGGLSGYYNGTYISNCHSAGTVYGYGHVGGLVGYILYAAVNQCSSAGSVGGDYCVGGLAGSNYGGVSDCYATNSVSGSSEVGGLVGENHSNIVNCYSIGPIGSGNYHVGGLVGYQSGGNVNHSFWDTETSGQMISAGGTGKTTAQMKTLSTFTGWDFATVWAICEETNYPRLQWQIPAGDFACPDGVSVEDLDYFVGRWLLNNCTFSNNYCGGGDINASGAVDLSDFAVLAGHWLEM